MPKSPEEEYEKEFQGWFKNQVNRIKTGSGVSLNPDPDDPRHQYDYRAAWKAGVVPSEETNWHWPSAFKADTHPDRFIDGVDTKTTHSLYQKENSMPQPLPLEPGRAGMGAPDYQMLTQLLGQDMQNRGQAYSPGAPQAALAGALDSPQGALPSIGTSDLLGSMNQARQGGNMEVMRALRSIIEGRTSDDAARGPGPRAPEARGKTSAEKESSRWNPFGVLSDALFGANNAGK
jgi:hypothetical protein